MNVCQLFICLSAHMSIYLSVSLALCVCLSVCLSFSVCVRVCVSVCLCFCMFGPSACLSVYRPVWTRSVSQSVSQSISLFVGLSVGQSVYVSVRVLLSVSIYLSLTPESVLATKHPMAWLACILLLLTSANRHNLTLPFTAGLIVASHCGVTPQSTRPTLGKSTPIAGVEPAERQIDSWESYAGCRSQTRCPGYDLKTIQQTSTNVAKL